jgi:pimeloyl-[acyl-carrier protein] methyl ester esterase
MRTIAVSGWGQPHDALAAIAPQATHARYAHHNTMEETLAAIAQAGADAELAVGWSLGGQLLTRAAAKKMLRPKKIVLIATPFQFTAGGDFPLGMGPDTYAKFRANYGRNPARTLDKAWELIAKNDARADAVRAQLQRFDKAAVLAENWLSWLHALDGFSAQDLPLADFPPTVLVHGKNDVVVDFRQSEYLAQRLPQAKVILWDDCGHAPHWHDPQALKELMGTHAI